ncbi:MAG: cysteine desulfurase [Alphaproteobacteria bacterium]|nr:cysteine desulfurase [Alphaproteobacteria bacterium]
MNKQNIYLDHNATYPPLKEVLDKVIPMMSRAANPSSIHKEGRVAKGLVEEARGNIMSALNISQFDYDLIFTSSGTEGNNMILQGLQEWHLFLPATEHSSITRLAYLRDKVTFLKVNKDGVLDLEYLRESLKLCESEKKLVSISHANNETGVMQNIKLISQVVHEEGAILHSDMVQTFGKVLCDLVDLGVDIATISSHKIGGFHGAAAVVKRADIEMPALLRGGGQERGFRAGTENTYAIASFGEAVKVTQSNLLRYRKLSHLRDNLESKILCFAPEAKIYSKNCTRLPNTSYIAMPGVNNQTQLINFDLKGFSVSAGSACSSGVVEKSHVLHAMDEKDWMSKNAIRISLGLGNSIEDVEKFINAWKEIYVSLSGHKNQIEEKVQYG